MRALAMTGMVTAALMPSIRAGSLMRATPPSRRMSAGTRSRAITDDGAGVLGDLGLLGGDHVHDHAAPQHLGQAPLDQVGAGATTGGQSAAVVAMLPVYGAPGSSPDATFVTRRPVPAGWAVAVGPTWDQTRIQVGRGADGTSSTQVRPGVSGPVRRWRPVAGSTTSALPLHVPQPAAAEEPRRRPCPTRIPSGIGAGGPPSPVAIARGDVRNELDDHVGGAQLLAPDRSTSAVPFWVRSHSPEAAFQSQVDRGPPGKLMPTCWPAPPRRPAKGAPGAKVGEQGGGRGVGGRRTAARDATLVYRLWGATSRFDR